MTLLSLLLTATLAFAANKTIKVEVTDKGFVPATIKAAPGDTVTLKVTRTTVETCATVVQIPDLKIKEPLPLNKTVTIKLGELAKGSIKFGCTMDMMESGVIVVE